MMGIRDLDREMLAKLNDKDMLRVCCINKNFYYNVCDNQYLRKRFKKYENIEEYKTDESLKSFFIRAVYYIFAMKEEFDFNYVKGNFKEQYYLLSHNYGMDSLLNEACGEGEISLVLHALNKGADAINGLIKASHKGYIDIVKTLIESGADIHKNDDMSLFWASYSGHTEIVIYLVEHGANINAQNGDILIVACKKGHFKIIQYLVEKGIDIFETGGVGLTWAASEGYYDIVKYLVERGADIHTRRQAALRWADEANHKEIVQYLLSVGCYYQF